MSKKLYRSVEIAEKNKGRFLRLLNSIGGIEIIQQTNVNTITFDKDGSCIAEYLIKCSNRRFTKIFRECAFNSIEIKNYHDGELSY